MREIKFRIWEINAKQVKPVHVEIVGAALKYHLPAGTFHGLQHLMQYTGLKDKNGVEIYEGDIVVKQQGQPHVVQYSETEGQNGGIIMGLRCRQPIRTT